MTGNAKDDDNEEEMRDDVKFITGKYNKKNKKKESIEETRVPSSDPFARFSSGTFGQQANRINESEQRLNEHLSRVLNEHLPEDIPVRTALDGHDLLVTDQHDVLFLEGSNLAVDTFQKMYSDIMEVYQETGRAHGCDWLDGFEGSFKEAYDRLTVEFKRMADSTFGDWPVSRLPNERGVEAPDPGAGFINR